LYETRKIMHIYIYIPFFGTNEQILNFLSSHQKNAIPLCVHIYIYINIDLKNKDSRQNDANNQKFISRKIITLQNLTFKKKRIRTHTIPHYKIK